MKSVPQEFREMYQSYLQPDNQDNYFTKEQILYYETKYSEKVKQLKTSKKLVEKFTLG